MQLAGEHQEGLAVHDQLRGGAALFKVRSGVRLSGEGSGLKTKTEQKDWQRTK
jgi:hypothetical protein